MADATTLYCALPPYRSTATAPLGSRCGGAKKKERLPHHGRTALRSQTMNKPFATAGSQAAACSDSP